MANGITYFRLKSPYEGDITKNCALDGAEVDNNFFILEGRDIKSVEVVDNAINIHLMNGKVISSGDVFSTFSQNMSIDFDAEHGILYVSQNGTTKKIEGFVTTYGNKDNVATDSTLSGSGVPSDPVGISPVYKTGFFTPVKKIIDGCNCREAESLLCGRHALPGDRYLVHTKNSEYGFLYNYDGVKKIACDLEASHSGWRIPTKDDWDDMLNAVEPCPTDRDHESATANKYLGHWAGRFLKSVDLWKSEGCCVTPQGANSTCIVYPDVCDDDDTNVNNQCGCGRDVDVCSPTACGEYNTCPHVHPGHCGGDHSGIDLFGFTVTPPGYMDDGNIYAYFRERAWYWTGSVSRAGTCAYTKRFEYNKTKVYQDITPTGYHLSLRLVKDYNGNNFHERENILTSNLPTVLMPSLKSGKKIWTAANIDFANQCYHPVVPNDGQAQTLVKKYFIYEWDGTKWLVNELHEGESVVVLNPPSGRYSVAYKIIHGDLVDLNLKITEEILQLIRPRLDHLEQLITNETQRAQSEEERIEQFAIGVSDRLNAEIVRSTQKDEELETTLNQEIADRIAADEEINGKLDEEIATRIAADEEINAKIEQETAERIAADEAEAEARSTKDAEHDARIEALEQKDIELEEKLNEEIEERIAADEELNTKIEQETAERIAADEAEAEARATKDAELEGDILTQEGTEFDSENGILTLKSADGTNDISVQFSFNFGEI